MIVSRFIRYSSWRIFHAAKGAEVNLKVVDGKRILLQITRDNGRTEIIELLKKYGAKK